MRGSDVVERGENVEPWRGCPGKFHVPYGVVFVCVVGPHVEAVYALHVRVYGRDARKSVKNNLTI